MTNIRLDYGDPIDLTLALIADDALPIGSEVATDHGWRWTRYTKGWGAYAHIETHPSLADLVQAVGQVTVARIARSPR